MEETFDRRRHRRFLVALPLRYRTGSGLTGTGETINMSSSGLLFRAAATIRVGDLVEAELAWPIRLEEEHPLMLKLYGITVRGTADLVAMTFSKYEFQKAM